MSRINRESFIGTLSNGGEGLDVDKLDAKTLEGAGISSQSLAQLAGGDHRISGQDELGRLFNLIDRVDPDSNSGSFATTKQGANGQVVATASGAVYDALTSQLERARLGAPHATKPKSGSTALPSPEVVQRSRAAIDRTGFTDVHLNQVPYFNQANPAWAQHDYPKSPPVPGELRTLRKAGCAPTALAMIDCGLRGSHTAPDTTADFAVKNQVSGTPSSKGTNTPALARTWAAQHGLSVTEGASKDQSKNIDVLRSGLAADGIALVSVGPGHFSDGRHVIVINGCAMRNGEEWFAVANPGRQDQTHPDEHHPLTVDDNVIQVGGAQNGVGRVWVKRSQLEAEMKACYVFNTEPPSGV